VTVPFRREPKSSKGKILWQEVKIALLARLGKHQTKAGETVTRLHQRRLVAVLGDINALNLAYNWKLSDKASLLLLK
jgi:hypothetical protein